MTNSEARTDLTPPAADYVAGPVQNDTIESFCATLRSVIADAHAERDRFGHIAATIRVSALHYGATNAEIDAMISGEISFVNWISDKVEALADRPASPDTRVTNLIRAVEALGAMPEGFCGCSKNRIGDDSKIHEPECRDVRKSLKEFDRG